MKTQLLEVSYNPSLRISSNLELKQSPPLRVQKVISALQSRRLLRFGIPKLAMTFILFHFILLFPRPVNAANYGLSIYPPLLRVNIKPGTTITQVFTLNNLTSNDKFLIARIVPFTRSDNFGNPIIDLKNTATWQDYFTLANSNITLGEPFTLKGVSSEQLIVTLSIPEDAVLRDLYATLMVSTYSNTLDIDYPGSLVSATIGSNMLITVNSEAFPPTILKINQIVPEQGTYIRIGNLYLADNITPITFTSTVSNDGNFAAETKGIFRVSRGVGEPMHLEGLLPVNVIANTTRNLINNEGENFIFSPTLSNIGNHRVTIQIQTENANAENSIDIFFFPFKILAGIILSLIFLYSIKNTIKKPVS